MSQVQEEYTYRGGGNIQLEKSPNQFVVRHTFNLTSTPGLGRLAGQSLNGDWTLHVQDLAAADARRLNRWELEIVGDYAVSTGLGGLDRWALKITRLD